MMTWMKCDEEGSWIFNLHVPQFIGVSDIN